MMSEFRPWPDIKRFEGIHVQITEKLDGSNGCIVITEDNIYAQSRNRILTLDSDNYEFARFVEEQKLELREILGTGFHYGEWYGCGIGTKYGMTERRFALFDVHRWKDNPNLPNRIDVVPVLYDGIYTENIIEKILNDLKENGSKMIIGWMKPEGIVIYFPQFGRRLKRVFKQEEVAWRGVKKEKVQGERVDHWDIANKYLQPERLKKLLIRDERYILDYPVTLPVIVREYIKDLEKEIENIDKIKLYSVKKVVFNWVKEIYETILET